MKLLLDAHLPFRLVAWFRERGHDALHTLELPAGNRTSDSEIVRRADVEDRIVVTKDSDFVHAHVLHGRPNRLLLVTTGNITNVAFVDHLAAYLPAVERAFLSSNFVELSRVALVVHK